MLPWREVFVNNQSSSRTYLRNLPLGLPDEWICGVYTILSLFISMGNLRIPVACLCEFPQETLTHPQIPFEGMSFICRPIIRGLDMILTGTSLLLLLTFVARTRPLTLTVLGQFVYVALGWKLCIGVLHVLLTAADSQDQFY